tara:strand:- start:1 stop:492 length:492 start_codon:yes stop_codon:yes gene_type:complete
VVKPFYSTTIPNLLLLPHCRRINITVKNVNSAFLSLSGETNISNTVFIDVSDPAYPGNYYYVLMALSNKTGFKLTPNGTDNRTVKIDPDGVLITSIYQPLTLGLINTPFFLDNTGRSRVVWNVPNIPSLKGTDIYLTFVTLDLKRPYPQAVTSIGNVVKTTLE